MAARIRTWTPEVVRQRIRAAQIVNRLTGHVLGRVAMEPSQVTAALGLLKKCVPDLSSTALTDNEGGPLKIEIVKFANHPPATEEQKAEFLGEDESP